MAIVLACEVCGGPTVGAVGEACEVCATERAKRVVAGDPIRKLWQAEDRAMRAKQKVGLIPATEAWSERRETERHLSEPVRFDESLSITWFTYRRNDGVMVTVEHHGPDPKLPDDADPEWVSERAKRGPIRVVAIDRAPGCRVASLTEAVEGYASLSVTVLRGKQKYQSWRMPP